MDNYLYLLINITSILIPFIFSFYHKTSFFPIWKKLFPGYIIMTTIYLIWDIIFTRMGIWGFNDQYLIVQYPLPSIRGMAILSVHSFRFIIHSL